MTDTRFAKTHVPSKVNGANHALLLLENQHSLQIILPGRMNLHRTSYPQRLYLPAKALLLDAEQLVIQTFFLHQFIMCAAFHQFSIVEDKNLVGIPNGTKPVSNHNDRLTLHQLCDGPLD